MKNSDDIKQLQKIKQHKAQYLLNLLHFLKSIQQFLIQRANFKALLLSIGLAAISLLFVLGISVFFIIRDLPRLAQIKNYHPPLVSFVVDRNEKKVGEFFRERRVLVPYTHFPEHLVQAFVSAEDGQFFVHKGLHYQAIFRAFLANLKKGRKVQGGSTITQQVARSVLLSSEKTYRRKLKEAILALRIEKALSKEEILYLYLNQIYLGHGAYGVGMAAKVYFRKKVKDLSLAECAMLAGLPKAPSRFSPIRNSKRARQRQLYVLQRMVEESYLSPQAAQQAADKSIKIYLKEKVRKTHPYYMEVIRQILSENLGEEQLLTGGLKIHTAMDGNMQTLAQKHLKAGLKQLDKRQGFRGPLKHLNAEEDIIVFFQEEEKKLTRKHKQFIFIGPEADKSKQLVLTQKQLGKSKLQKGSLANKNPLENKVIPFDVEDEAWAVVRMVSDSDKQVLVELAFKQFGIIPLENMKWARQPNPKISFKYAKLLKPSLALKAGDVIQVKIESLEYSDAVLKIPLDTNTSVGSKKLLELSLDQEPLVEGAMLVFDQKTEDITALVGGYDFVRSQFNRAYQAARQTGSVFKPIVYLAALDKGFTPADLITDAPVIYAKEEAAEGEELNIATETIKNKDSIAELDDLTTDEESQDSTDHKWKPFNYSRRFSGDILFRNALIRSMNVPTVKVIERIGIKWVRDYAHRLGLFHSLNPDYTLALGSSSVTLYEMTKAFSIIGRLGKKIRPRILRKVSLEQDDLLDSISLDSRFVNQLQTIEQEMEEKKQNFLDKIDSEDMPNTTPYRGVSFFFNNPDQLISQQTAFIMTTLLSGAIQEPGGTGYRARSLSRAAAGKTGTTNGYYDAWFIGYTPHLIAGVWVGFDDEKSLGIGETGARAALPIWLEFMKSVYAAELIDKETETQDFAVPEGIVFANIDNETGQLVTSRSKKVVNQAFVEGTQPTDSNEYTEIQEDQDFLREDLSE